MEDSSTSVSNDTSLKKSRKVITEKSLQSVCAKFLENQWTLIGTIYKYIVISIT